MRHRRTPKPILVAAAFAAVVVLGGCDAQENADLENGRAMFTEQCGRCHALAEAGSESVVGPDLDAAFAAARESGMDNDTIEGVVEQQIEVPRFVDEDDPTYMPPDLVTGDDARDVAAYVASVAGVPGIQAPVAPGGPGGQVYLSANCGSCHAFAAAESSGVTGPNLDEVLRGWSPEEVRTAIVDPSAEIAEGFEDGIMPANYEETITPEDLDLLVDFLVECTGKPVGCGDDGGGGGGGASAGG